MKLLTFCPLIALFVPFFLIFSCLHCNLFVLEIKTSLPNISCIVILGIEDKDRMIL